MRARIAVLASGRGSNLQAILDYLERLSGQASYEVALVLSNRSDSPALDLGRTRGIPAFSFVADDDGRALKALLAEHSVAIVALAGYLRKIPASIVAEYSGCVVNIHPALLPAHGGTGMYGEKIHRAVLAAGDAETGVTVHLVDNEYDRGPLVAQWRIPVLPGDDAHSLAQRVLVLEHAVYPRALDILAAIHLLKVNS